MVSPHESHESLRENEERLRLAIEAAGISICEWLIPEDTVTWSENVDRLFGFPQGAFQINYATFLERIYEEDRERVRGILEEAIANCSHHSVEFRIVWPDGTVRWLVGTGRMYPGPTGQAVRMIACAFDITARKEAEERMRKSHEELLRRVVGAQEDERKRISRGLHDKVGQDLTTLSLGLKSLESSTGSGDYRRQVAILQETVARIGGDLHDLALELRPPALDDLGLYTALVHYLAEWSERSGLEIDFHGTSIQGKRYSSAVEMTVYRIVQEALTNVERHSRAARAGVVIEKRPGELIVIVEDDGQGFEADWDSIAQSGRLGLLCMRDRANSVGGTLEIESSPSTHTTVMARIPVGTGEGRS